MEDLTDYITAKYGPPPKEMTYRAIGVIIQAGNGIFRRVKWEDGEIESVSLPELKPLVKGQRFEAMVTRKTTEPNRYKLLGMKDVKPLPPLKPLSREESLALWERIGANNKGETVSWDELDEDFWLKGEDMYVAVVNITEAQACELRLMGLEIRLLNDAGGAYNGWHQLTDTHANRERLRTWLSTRPEVENRFF